MAFGLELEQGLAQQLNQFQLQSLNILSMDNRELDQFLQNEYAENPLLDYDNVREMPGIFHGDVSECKNQGNLDLKADEPDTKKDIFMSQIHLNHLTDRQIEMVEYFIECTSDTGMLLISLEEISENLKISLDQVIECHEMLINLEPAGVFARSLEECLMFQLERNGQLDENMRRIVLEHLSDVASGHISSITRDLGMKTVEVRKCIQRIQGLNPRPLRGFSKEKIEYIVPDIILSKYENQWKIELNDHWIGNYSLNDYYLKMMKDIQDPDLKEYFQKKYERSRFIISSIEQRRETIKKIVWALYERQEDYFTKQGKLKPMAMQNIAKDTNMHVSTVSRAAKGKYIQYPFGTVLIKDLFTSAYSFGNQENTAIDIKKELNKLIMEEDKKKPYSDSKLVQLLLEKNMKLSRRTVAKYREELGIQGTYKRKEV